MRFWLSVHFPLLPLETLRPSWTEPGSYAVLHQECVVVASNAAFAAGVRIGMRIGGVAATSPDTILLQRDLAREQLALDAITLGMLQYTPEVAHAEQHSILLDVTASLRAFGGRLALCRRVRATIKALGFSALLGAAPTALAAWLLARCARIRGRPLRRRIVKMSSLPARLDRLPCALLPAAHGYREWLSGIGAEDLGALRRLPRAGLVRRTSKLLLDSLDQAYGQAPQLFDWIKIPATFSARIETVDRIEQADALLIGAHYLVAQFTGWLVSLRQAVSLFVLLLEHERGRTAIAATEIEIALGEPTWREEHLIRLLKERLGRIELVAPVIALRLEARRLAPMLPSTDSLFPEPGGSPAEFNRLLELLTARLGKAAIRAAVDVHDYRPDAANSWAPVADSRLPPEFDDAVVDRPFWCLAEPLLLRVHKNRPFYGSSLKLIAGPERVEAGWWDDGLVVRDYYKAQGSDGSCYWIYLERESDARWFLHGLYG